MLQSAEHPCTPGSGTDTGCSGYSFSVPYLENAGSLRVKRMKISSQTKRMIPGYSQVYKTLDGDKRIQLRNIPAGSVIDWGHILDEYHGGETDEQKQAIAQLMYWVGVGCKMSYGGSSAAGFPEGVKALINYFGYDDGTHIESRGNFTASAWEDLLYNELLTGHPIAFAGTNTVVEPYSH